MHLCIQMTYTHFIVEKYIFDSIVLLAILLNFTQILLEKKHNIFLNITL